MRPPIRVHFASPFVTDVGLTDKYLTLDVHMELHHAIISVFVLCLNSGQKKQIVRGEH